MAAVAWLVLDLSERRRVARLSRPRCCRRPPARVSRIALAAFLPRRRSPTWSGALWGYGLPAAARGRRHHARPSAFFTASAQCRPDRRRVRARAAACGGDLGGGHAILCLPGGCCCAPPSVVALAADSQGGRVGVRRRSSRRSRSPVNAASQPVRFRSDRSPQARCSSPGACALALARRQRPDAPHLAGRRGSPCSFSRLLASGAVAM